MLRSWRIVVLALAAASSGCWSEACIDANRNLCADDMGSIWIARDEQQQVDGVTCEVRLPLTTCQDEGYTYACYGAWSRTRC